MRNQSETRTTMPFFNTFKTATAVGLLMQQVSVLPCIEGSRHPLSAPSGFFFPDQKLAPFASMQIKEALSFLAELTSMLNEAYSLLLKSTDENISFVIESLNPETCDLIELQLRGLEGAIKNVYNECDDTKKNLVKNPLIVTAKARASAAKLNHLISQMTHSIELFESKIDMEGLRALADHGSEVFASGRFH